MMRGFAALEKGMKSLGAARATGQAQEDVNAINANVTDEMEKRKKLAAVAQNLTLSLSGMGVDPTQVAQAGGAITPKQYNLTDEGIMQSRDDSLKESESARAYDWKKTLFNRETQLQLAGLKAAAGSTPGGQFKKELHKQTAKSFAQELENVGKLQTGLSDVDDALSALEQYGESTMMGTGPIATGFGMKKYLSRDTEALDAKLKKINLTNMATTFSGMSRAIDSEVERKAWESTQADISNDDKTNAAVLLGAKSLMLKQAFEMQQKADYADQKGDLDGYRSKLSQVISMMNPKGQMELVHKKQIPELKKAGYQSVDKFASDSWGKIPVQRSSFGSDAIQSGDAPAMSDKKAKALDWISKNPNDPRVPKIKQALGIE